MQAKPHEFLSAIKGFRDDLVVGAECMFTWYWLADVCLDEKIKFILGHALYLKAIHGGKKKDDKLDAPTKLVASNCERLTLWSCEFVQRRGLL